MADGVLGRPAPPRGSQWLRVAVVRLPRISNATDAEALACEPGVAVRYVTEPSRLADADLVVLPGSKSTVSDLAWLRRTGLADAVLAHAARRASGARHLRRLPDARARASVDPHGWRAASADGLGPARPGDRVRPRTSTWPTRPAPRWGEPVRGYEIHHGRVVRSRRPAAAATRPRVPTPGRVLGTHWHGLLENDGFRRALLRRVADQAGRDGLRPRPGHLASPPQRDRQLDLLGDLVEEHLDIRRA